MSSTIKVKFNHAISCVDGSFAAGQVVNLSDTLAGPWLKNKTVSLAEKETVTVVDTGAVKTPFVSKDTPVQKAKTKPSPSKNR